ncbi:unnamed protein product [Brassica oleracea]|uniref:Uncharacterized protein n=1 Tax=Brassica oleracea TaxID=3712 RepID=A0A3P6G7X2_BRAOL|nr:unnamed protein product [Brassica oleracea]
MISFKADTFQGKLQNGSVDQAWRTDGFNTYQWLKPSSGLLLKDVCRVEADVCIHGITSANKRTTIATQVSLGLYGCVRRKAEAESQAAGWINIGAQAKRKEPGAQQG